MLLLQTSGLKVERIELFDHSLEVLGFPNSPFKGRILKALRGTLRGINPILFHVPLWRFMSTSLKQQ
jgi:hypothetical protein